MYNDMEDFVGSRQIFGCTLGVMDYDRMIAILVLDNLIILPLLHVFYNMLE